MNQASLQDPRGFFVLPQAPEEAGYYTYGTPTRGAGQYAHPKMLTFLFLLELRWASSEERKFGVGNISLAAGQLFPPHKTHRTGLEVDLRPLRKDGKHQPVRYQDGQYDREATRKLVGLMLATGMVRQIGFNDPHIRGVNPLRGHDDHLHVVIHP